ncbi:hypothetical protein MIND_01247900 [Mycena indigotica]|uniref:Uncharacterized protein n=1 Tax=Mycena indigotica TaxID=2126181 RepID=A0A8H6S3Q5_9AGAR|nr:uncharacterized protein MIND_01247900 [Mycena indigotica]KAF7292206.1 hypothetical protein MIND_01247900 [Mycena indigotica]
MASASRTRRPRRAGRRWGELVGQGTGRGLPLTIRQSGVCVDMAWRKWRPPLPCLFAPAGTDATLKAPAPATSVVSKLNNSPVWLASELVVTDWPDTERGGLQSGTGTREGTARLHSSRFPPPLHHTYPRLQIRYGRPVPRLPQGRVYRRQTRLLPGNSAPLSWSGALRGQVDALPVVRDCGDHSLWERFFGMWVSFVEAVVGRQDGGHIWRVCAEREPRSP